MSPRPARTIRLLLAVTLGASLLPATAAAASSSVEQVVDITFPVNDPRGLTSYSNDYFGARSRGDHGATDIGGARAYGVPVHAAVGGRIRSIQGLDGRPPSWGYAITIEGTDGRSYSYLHLGRNDGPPSEAYAPGLERGTVVARGQHIGYIGHSGNASPSWPHLHFEISDPTVTDRQGSNRINPYFSLKAAERRGDYPSGSVARTSGAGFADVPAGHTHADGIAWVARRGVTDGCRPLLYCPSQPVTRGQMATFIMRAMDLPAGEPHGFTDVPSSYTHARGIAAVKAAGIANGLGDGRFDPQAVVRRDQMATFLRNALELPGSERTYPDVPAGSTHAAAIGAIGDAGITRGTASGDYQPNAPVERAQMATFLERAFGRS